MASYAHTTERPRAGGGVAHDNCWFDGKEYHPYGKGLSHINLTPEQVFLASDEPGLWRRLR